MARIIPSKQSYSSRIQPLSIKDYYKIKDNVLIVREWGGLGDLLMIRMIFEDIKLLSPESKIIFACPKKYHEAVIDHPFVEKVIDCENIDYKDYHLSYDLTPVCDTYEINIAPRADKHRAEIFSLFCGLTLTKHNMHITLPQGLVKECRNILETHKTNKNNPIILFSPVSAMTSKNLNKEQINGVVKQLQNHGATILGFHKEIIPDITTITPSSLIYFLGFIEAADYIISVDTSIFHASQNKPVVAIFGWADGKVYGKFHEKMILVQRHRDNGNWDCGPCFQWGLCPKDQVNIVKPCIREITADEIVEATLKLMEKYPYGI